MFVSSNSKSQKGGRKGWTTEEQFNWLQERIPLYLDSRAEGQLGLNQFWIQLYDGWFECWPVEPGHNNEALKLVCDVI